MRDRARRGDRGEEEERRKEERGGQEGKASVSACGFGLCAFVVAVERGWVGKKEAEKRVEEVS